MEGDGRWVIGTDPLDRALARYVEAVRTEFQIRKLAARPGDARLALLISEDQILLRAVEHAEQGQEFQDLVQQAAAVYCPERAADGSLSTLYRQIGEFFQISGIYCELFDGRPVQHDERLSRLKASLEATSQTITHNAPIEWVYFGKAAIRFGEFEVRRLPMTELEAIFSDRVRRIFYPWARISAGELAEYWFLVAKETVAVDPAGKVPLRLSFQVDPHCPRFSAPIDHALSLLALGDWVTRAPLAPDGRPRMSDGLDALTLARVTLVPFVISVSTNCLKRLRRAPDTSVLTWVEEVDARTGETSSALTSTHTGTRPRLKDSNNSSRARSATWMRSVLTNSSGPSWTLP